VAEFQTVGDLLRRAREEKGLSLEQVNQETKISVQTLANLEQDDLEAFESETYLRGFLKNYASFLGLDLEKVMRTLERQRGRAAPGQGALWDIEEAVKEEKLGPPRNLSRLVIVLLLAAVVVLLLLFLRERNKVAQLERKLSSLAPPPVPALVPREVERRQGWDVQARI